MALVPMMAGVSVLQMQMMNGTFGDSDGLDGGADAGVILGGALNGVTTVTAFNMQEETSKKYHKVKYLIFITCCVVYIHQLYQVHQCTCLMVKNWILDNIEENIAHRSSTFSGELVPRLLLCLRRLRGMNS